MGVRFPASSSAVVNTGTLVTTGLTTILVCPSISISLDFAVILLFWYAAITLGTAATGLVVGLRRGSSASGALVNTAPTISGTAGNTLTFSGCFADVAAPLGPLQYNLSVSQVAATGNGAVIEGCIMAMSL